MKLSTRMSSSLLVATLGVPGCGPAEDTLRGSEPLTASIDQALCPDGPCSPRDPRDPPPEPPPTYYYPAAGWTIINASESNNLRGIQWWAYQWEDSRLRVKAYYPADYRTGITAGDETAHAFLTFDVKNPVDWKAWSSVNLERGGVIRPQNGFAQAYLDGNGVITQYATQGWQICNGDICETHEYFGIYQDGGTGTKLVQGDDALTSVGAGIIFGFLNDFRESGGVLSPPGTEHHSCGYDCENGLRQYIARRQAFLSGLVDSDQPPYLECGSAGAFTALCAYAGSMWWLGLFGGPPAWVTEGVVLGFCFAGASGIVACGAAIGNYDPPPAGTCVIVVSPTWVVGPDGRSTQITYQVQNVGACK